MVRFRSKRALTASALYTKYLPASGPPSSIARNRDTSLADKCRSTAHRAGLPVARDSRRKGPLSAAKPGSHQGLDCGTRQSRRVKAFHGNTLPTSPSAAANQICLQQLLRPMQLPGARNTAGGIREADCMPAQDIPPPLCRIPRALQSRQDELKFFLQFSDSGFWRCGGFWRYPDSPGNRRISHGRHAR